MTLSDDFDSFLKISKFQRTIALPAPCENVANDAARPWGVLCINMSLACVEIPDLEFPPPAAWNAALVVWSANDGMRCDAHATACMRWHGVRQCAMP